MPAPEIPHADLSDLDARFARLRQEYGQRRENAHTVVRRWEWYSAEAYDPRPLWYERDLHKPGHRLGQRPPQDRDHCRIGFDADDRPVVIEEHISGKLYYETFHDHLADAEMTTATHFRAGGGPIYLHEYRFEAGGIRSAWTVATGGGGYEEYEYTGDRVTRLRTYHANRTGKPGSRLNPLAPYQIINAAYDEAGLSRLEIAWAGDRTEVKYERPPADFTLAATVRAVRQALIRQVPAVLREMAIDEPAYCVALGYLPEDPIGVSVHVGLDSDRREWLAEQSDADDAEADTFVIWNPCDLYRGPESVEYGEAADTARLLRQELTLADADADADTAGDADAGTSGVNEHGRQLLCAIAAELNDHDWADVLPVTDDFVVYAADWEMADFDRNLAECVPADRLTTLRGRGLL